jgi:hypothetical protein
MTSNSEQPTMQEDSSVPLATDTTQQTEERKYEYRTLASQWSSIEPETQDALWTSDPLVPPIINSLYWMWNHTKTRDDQDQNHPYKPYPVREYLKALHAVWVREPFLFVEKSRTMLASWWAAGETTHFGMTHQPSTTVYWAQDEDRAVALLNYSKTLYGQQDDIFKTIFPLKRPLDQQAEKEWSLKDGGIFMALPGKDPDKIRSLHPTQLVIDEACFIENGGEAFDVAISSRVPKVLVISSAAPSWFRRLTKDARPISLDKYL